MGLQAAGKPVMMRAYGLSPKARGSRQSRDALDMVARLDQVNR